MVFFRKYGKIQRIFPAVDTRIPDSDPAFVLLANGARNGLILDHLFYQAPPSDGETCFYGVKTRPLSKTVLPCTGDQAGRDLD